MYIILLLGLHWCSYTPPCHDEPINITNLSTHISRYQNRFARATTNGREDGLTSRIRGLGWMCETCSFCVLKMGIPSEKQFFIWNMVINQWVQRHHMFRSHFYPGEAHFVALPSHGLILAAPSILRPGRGWICTIHHTWWKKRAWTLTSSPKGVIWGKKPILAELDTLHQRIHTPILLCKILGQQIILGQETPNSVGGVEG
jgi:hypothetical protein